jgi:tetratricopeptide (TPR) repeat protein
MTLVTIREQPGANENGFSVTVSFDNGAEHAATVRDPFTEAEEGQLQWYFEEHLRFPFVKRVEAQRAAASIGPYGESLFEQLFKNREAYGCYTTCRQSDPDGFHFEIAGSPEFHALHWESLKDPKLPQPFAVQIPMVRKNLRPRAVEGRVRPAPTVNILVVTARPSGARDVGYRTISRPLVETQRQAELPMRIDILRPGTLRAFVEHLDAKRLSSGDETEPGGYYHVVHFDVHGALLAFDELQQGRDEDRFLFQARYGLDDIQPYDGQKAFLFFEAETKGVAVPVEATELANLLTTHQVPLALLNACQSGMQVGDTETSLGSQLILGGVQMVVAMGYSVTVSAAELLMREFYTRVAEGGLPAECLRRARYELFNDKTRRAYFNETVDLEDWLLPVVYQNREQQFSLRDFTDEERIGHLGRLEQRYRFAEPEYGFVGRDLDVLEIERSLLARNMLLLRGMGGAGKTTLLRHLAGWWSTTNFVEQIFYFGYDEKAWNCQQIVHDIARKLLDEQTYRAEFEPLSLDLQPAYVAEKLRARRHLLILDNLESITGAELAIQHKLPEKERNQLRDFLRKLSGGKTLVLFGSRGSEQWLYDGTFEKEVYDLPGLDEEAVSMLADLILAKHNATQYRETPELGRLMKLLAGYPLALQVVLANLARQTPAEVLAALRAGDVDLDSGDSGEKTKNILRCIEYSNSNLSPEAQTLLSCLAPFTSVVFQPSLTEYTERLREQPLLAELPFDRWEDVLQEAHNWGLLKPHDLPGFLELQPTLPYFLRTRLRQQADVQTAIETAFRTHYDQGAGSIYEMLESKDAKEKQTGQAVVRLEAENLRAALDLSLTAHVSVLEPYRALSKYFDQQQDHRGGLELGKQVLDGLENYPPEIVTGPMADEYTAVLHSVAARYLHFKRYDEAERFYRKALETLQQNKSFDADEKRRKSASIYHQLGRVAEDQRQWKQAEQHYREALTIKIEFDDRYSQASTYHQLGIVAQGQRQWKQAEQHYRNALAIKIEFDERYAQALTYHQLGSVAEVRQQWKQAEQYFREALAIFDEFDERYSQASTYHQLGIVAQEQRQWKQAEQHYRQALHIFIEFKDRYEQAGTYHQLGTVAEVQRQWEEARGSFLNALALYVEYNDQHNLAIVIGGLARVWDASGDATLPAAVAEVLGITAEEAEERLRKAPPEES